MLGPFFLSRTPDGVRAGRPGGGEMGKRESEEGRMKEYNGEGVTMIQVVQMV